VHEDVREHEAAPWFRRRPELALAVAAALYTGVFVLRLVVDGAVEAVSLLFVLPIALVAVSFGRRAGIVAGFVGVGLLLAWLTVEGESLSAVAWVARITPMVLLGVLLGGASDRLQEAAAADHRLALAELRQREAAEINDAIVQRLAAAKWALESGDVARADALLIESIETAEALVRELLAAAPDAMKVRAAV
jgi:K+-sensing histidine kinase KdpD